MRVGAVAGEQQARRSGRGVLEGRYGAVVTPLTVRTFNDLPAQEFSATFGATARTFVLIERGCWLYRVVYDPRSPLTLGVLETIRIA